MKPGNEEPPLFMIPGATGSVLQLAPIASAMTLPMPVYAIKPRGMAEGETPCEQLAEMAEHAIGVMTAVRPQGPYLLVGYSVGGLVALEVARGLSAAGHDVPLVVLLDTYPSRETWPLGCHLAILVRQAVRAVWSVGQYKALRHAVDDMTRRVRSLFFYLAASGVRLVAPPPVIAEGSNAASRRVHLATFNAGEAYRPSRYSGKVVFLQPEFIPNLEPRDPYLVWGRFLTDMAVRRVPGSHLAMLDEGAAATASAICGCLADQRTW
jgi:acetoacetyl-CoA synthetase